MNLWVKRTGQLFIAVLFLMSCEDDKFLLGFRNQNNKFNVRYHEISFTGDQTSVLLIDSTYTDHFDLTGSIRFLLGQYSDPAFGMIQSEVFTQFGPGDYSQINKTGATFDSILMEMRVDFYAYGSTGDSEEKFRIHRLTDSLSYYKRYHYNSTLGYDPTPLAEASFDLDYFTFQRNNNLGSTERDTVLIKAVLDYGFGLELFNYASSYDSALFDVKVFKEQFKGLVIVPEQNNYILGVDPTSGLSKFTLYYHTVDTALSRSFYLSPFTPPGAVSFNKISANRTGDLAGSQPYLPYAPSSGFRYIENGAPVITKLDLTPYYDFIRGEGAEDSLKQIVINAAQLTIGIEPPATGFNPPSTLILRVLKKTSHSGTFGFMNNVIDADSTSMRGFYLVGDDKYYLAAGDVSQVQAVELVYDPSKKQYLGNMTMFLQNLFDRKNDEVSIEYLGLFPVSPNIGKTVNRVVFKQENIKLGIHYSAPTVNNPE